MDSLSSILANKSFDEPDEIQTIKDYVRDNFGETVKVQIRERDIIIYSQSAGLIASLRMRGPELTRLCQTNKKLIFRIG